ncbi:MULTISPECIES: type IV pilus modification protein PilV [Delftia]|uniref:type IV pilus modification protein PilV n=1 Tax=Delftia TaxID=80865 RepID=UPI00116E0DF4|nr:MULTISPECIES: type IV pilus modification protein PilV [Delftia]MCB4785482.1 type IV pilus modification protein PilV [Delftia sp. Lp-1]TQL71902.1 type IV pilus assembly protein PilV [Delftia sp. HK171]
MLPSSIAERKSSKGLTLIEMMVALVVLSIGLLGVAGLQASTTKYRINTMARASMTGLVFDLSERIRVNADSAGPSFLQPGTESLKSLYVIGSDWSTQQTESLTPTKDCAANTCNTAERADYDVKTWRQKVRDSVPQGSAMLSGNKRDGVLLTLMWFDKELTDRTTASDGSVAIALKKAPVCNADQTGMSQQTCCPEEAKVPEGVRCSRFSFVP